jgi:4-hydroxy-tetrahydrodipicolinate synthase
LNSRTFFAGCKGLRYAFDGSYRGGLEAEAENFYRAMLPAAVFTMQGIENLLRCGQRLFGASGYSSL